MSSLTSETLSCFNLVWHPMSDAFSHRGNTRVRQPSNFLTLEFMDTNVSHLIATRKEATIWAERNAANRIDHLVDL